MTTKALRHPDWIIAVLLTLGALWLHVVFLTHAGGLWRDEVAITNISLLPTLGQVWRALPHDHCPIVFPLLVRLWAGLGIGTTDSGLRLLGLGFGLLLLSAFWVAARLMGKGLPLLSVALAGLNFTMIRYGDSLRAYGLATACIVLATALIWRFVEVPGPRRGCLAAIGAVVSVQALYQNAFFLLALCLAGAAVCLRRGRPRAALGVLAIGLAAAISLLPYVAPLCHAQSWWIVSKTGITWAIFFNRIAQATGILAGVWLVLPLLTVLFGAGYSLANPSAEKSVPHRDLPVFGTIALAIGLTAFGIFIKLTGLPTQCWYYIPAMGFLVVCCDVILPRIHPGAPIVVWVVALSVGALAFSAALVNLKWRQTNGDLVAAQVSQRAGPQDLIIVHPWYYGVTFARYYRGPGPWTTLPPLSDYRFFRYDLLRSKLQRTNAIEPVIKKVKTTLRSGHRVWLVGKIPTPQPGTPPVELPPAPHGPKGWDDQPYSDAWGAQISYFLLHHATNIVLLTPSDTNSVNPMEDMALIRASGWRVSGPAKSP